MEERHCCVCLDAPATVRLMPCGHDEFCTNCLVEQACRWCSNDAPECPVCRTPYKEIMLPPSANPSPNGNQEEAGGAAPGPVEVRVDACEESLHNGQFASDPSPVSLAASTPLPPSAAAASLGALAEAGGAGGDMVVASSDIVFASPSGEVHDSTPPSSSPIRYLGDGAGDEGGQQAPAAAAAGAARAERGGALTYGIVGSLVPVANVRVVGIDGASPPTGT
uniref:RING-type domain-containing protein n=1 Tax=Hemiselmis andersenii TaxID=464988 RepID=A0A6U5CJR0_HEMAN